MNNAYNSSDFLNFTVGQPTEESNYEFRMMFTVFYYNTKDIPNDIDRIGTFQVFNEQYLWNPHYGNLTNISTEIKFHSCSRNDIKKFGETA